MEYEWANQWARKPAGKLTVYIVDDDPAVRDALGLLLSVRGYRTAVFANGEGFLNAWQSDWAGCLIVDIRMPGMDGLTLQKKRMKNSTAISRAVNLQSFSLKV